MPTQTSVTTGVVQIILSLLELTRAKPGKSYQPPQEEHGIAYCIPPCLSLRYLRERQSNGLIPIDKPPFSSRDFSFDRNDCRPRLILYRAATERQGASSESLLEIKPISSRRLEARDRRRCCMVAMAEGLYRTAAVGENAVAMQAFGCIL
jgi:hypothetical protein